MFVFTKLHVSSNGKKTKPKTKKKVVDKSSGSLTLVSYKKEDGLIEEKKWKIKKKQFVVPTRFHSFL